MKKGDRERKRERYGNFRIVQHRQDSSKSRHLSTRGMMKRREGERRSRKRTNMRVKEFGQKKGSRNCDLFFCDYRFASFKPSIDPQFRHRAEHLYHSDDPKLKKCPFLHLLDHHPHPHFGYSGSSD